MWSSNVQFISYSILIGVEYQTFYQTLDVYLLFGILHRQLKSDVIKKVSLIVTIKFAIVFEKYLSQFCQRFFFLSSDFTLDNEDFPKLPLPVRNIPKLPLPVPNIPKLPLPVRNIPKNSQDFGASNNSVWGRLGPLVEKNYGNWTFDT